MKRKMFVSLGTLAFAAAAVLTFNVALTEKSQSSNSWSLALLIKEAQAGTEGCTTTPGSNTGACKQNVSGKEWNCVTPGTWDSKNCSGD
ncbi:MAG TPA: hypothetical protein VLZ83_01605 [Edaphocola sp.]|nr:hypothetical protein [Edaphocola sp.]